nr:beta-lactamase family protein [Bacteroidota bacterium]
IASFTKPFTAMLILQLVEDGKLELDGKLTQYLPVFPEEKGADITIHQLLTHTAGITGESRIPNLIDIEKEFYTREQLLECIAKRDLVYKPGKGREYSNFGYALLGMVIENVTGKSYDEVLFEKICKPAGMKNTLSDVTAMPIENRATGYTYDYFTGLKKASFLDMSFTLGAGQLLSTPEDLFLFDKALYTNKLLTEASKELFFDYYGWFSMRYPYGSGLKKIRSYSLDGSINGFQSHTHRIETDKVFISVLRNVKESVYENQIVIKWPTFMVSRILAVIYGEPYDPPRKSGAFTVFKTLLDSGTLEAENLYKKIESKQTDQYYLEEKEFEFFTKELKNNCMENQAISYQKICFNLK